MDSARKIHIADNGYYAPAVVRVDDMTGANWTSLYVSPSGSTGLNIIRPNQHSEYFQGTDVPSVQPWNLASGRDSLYL